MLMNLLFLLALVSIVAILVYLGFQKTQQNATERSATGLADQGRDALLKFTQREAEIANLWLQRASSTSAVAAAYMVEMDSANGQVPWSIDRLAEASDGQLYDPSPDRRTEVWIGQDTNMTPQLERDLQESAVFDTLFPAMAAQSPDILAIYYMSPAGLGRYYPIVDLVDRLDPDFPIFEQPFYALAIPEANPEKSVVWSPPYIDFVGSGPIVTASAPVYNEATFRGVVSVDISLTNLIRRLNELAPSPGSYAFLIDKNERFVAASPRALRDLLGSSFSNAESITITETLGIPLNESENPQVLDALAEMQKEVSGWVEMDLRDQSVLLAYAWLPAVNWKLGIVAPLAEITAQSAIVADAIQQDATQTVRSTLLVIAAFFFAALLVIAFISRRLIVQRVERLALGTKAIAAGDLNVRIPVSGDDELDQLADSFNRMAVQLVAARYNLEERVARRTKELAALYDVTAVASASLDLNTLLNQSLDRVLKALACSSGAIHLIQVENQTLEMSACRDIPETLQTIIGQQKVGGGIIGKILTQKEPLIVNNLFRDSHFTLDTAHLPEEALTYMGVPMHAKGKAIGVLSVLRPSDQTFSSDETALLVSFGDQIGVAAENAQLYQQAEELAVIQERQRLARDLHDAVTQSVYSATLLAATGQRAASAGDWKQVRNFLKRLETVTNQALKELRLLVFELRPSALQDAGLIEALQHRLDAVEKRAGIKTRFLVESDIELGEKQEVMLYRIAIEALNNALKHANASTVCIRLTRHSKNVLLLISDDGQGFDPAVIKDQGGVGLVSMRERAVELGGEIEIESDPGKGTIVTVRLAENTFGAKT
jgi:nitrate/nitrite-specific signal transduction histidine kinase